MTLLKAIPLRHSVRRYKDTPLPADIIDSLRAKVAELNSEGDLSISLVLDEPKAFRGVLSYGKFYGVRNYFIISGRKSPTLDERAGYYGQLLVLYAQTLGLNTCWVGLSYHKVSGTYTLEDDEKIVCYIAVGYGEDQGHAHKTKTIEELSNAGPATPAWFRDAVEAARLAPTAVNQQKFYLRYIAPATPYSTPVVRAERRFSLIGYTRIDLGIAKANFAIAAAPHPFTWQ